MNLEKRNSPTYLSKYGLSRAPFSTNIEHDMFYSEACRAQRLDILLHLSQYSHDILLVSGPEGSGKTTLLNQFLHQAQKSWQFCQIDAHPLIDEEQLILRISHGFNLQVEHFDLENAEQDLKEHIIVVDNTHILNKNVLALLCRLTSVKDEQKDISVRLILFSQPAIRPTISQLDFTYRTFDLPPFDELASKELIHHRMSIAGAKDQQIFSDANIKKIHKLSYGNPSKILDISHRILTEAPTIKRETYKGEPQTPVPQKLKKKRPKLLPLTILVATIALVTVVLSYQDDINRVFTYAKENKEPSVDLDLPHKPSHRSDIVNDDLGDKKIIVALKIPELKKPTVQQPTVTTDPQQPIKNEHKIVDSSDKKLADKLILADSIPAAESKLETNNTPDKEPKSHTKSKPLSKPKPIDKSASVAKQSHNDVKPKAKNNKPAKTVKGLKSETWILKQNPKHRTLQLIAGYQYETLTNYIKKHKLPKSKLAYYRSQNKGKHWHSLIYGIYPDYQRAKSAAKKLRKKLGKNKPWIRKLKSIQNDIKNRDKP